MRWQDEAPIHELIADGAQIDGAYLAVARVGEDRKEAQIGSRPISDVDDARAWLDRTADAAVADAQEVRLRIRLWRADRTSVRGIQTRAWPDAEDVALSAAPTGDAAGAPVGRDRGPLDDDTTDFGGKEPASVPTSPLRRNPAPGTTLAVRRPQPVVTRPAMSSRPPLRVQTRPPAAAPPMYTAPCPTCAAATTTTALLQSRIAELSAMLAAAAGSVRDAQRAAQEAEQTARSRGRRLKEAEAEIARLRAEEKRLDAQVADLYNGVVAMRNLAADFDE